MQPVYISPVIAHIYLSKYVCFVFMCVPVFQLYPELSALPEQHDSGWLHDGSGCSVPAGDWWSPCSQITVPCCVPGNGRKRQTEAEKSQRAGWREGLCFVCKYSMDMIQKSRFYNICLFCHMIQSRKNYIQFLNIFTAAFCSHHGKNICAQFLVIRHEILFLL